MEPYHFEIPYEKQTAPATGSDTELPAKGFRHFVR